ncbi:PA14 domain-containing protein, partial [Microbacterium aoyamense]|uniref:PA14 domain-containing protein n=1 Tax=Microbacterium aoyamense TaxID=344166 RepID=UPI002004631F
LLRELLLIDDLSRHGIDHLDDIGHRPSFQSGHTRSTVNQTVPIEQPLSRGELGDVVARSEFTTEYEALNGGTALQVSQSPLNAESLDGSWSEIETSVEQTGDGWSVPSHPLRPAFAETADSDDAVTLRRDGHVLRIALEGADEGRAEAPFWWWDDWDALAFRDVGEGLDVEYDIERGAVKETLIVHERPVRGESSWSWVVKARSVTPRIADGETVEFFDRYGDVVVTIPTPVVWDSSGSDGQRSPAETFPRVSVDEISKGVWRYTLTADEDWTRSTDRVFPLYVDPTFAVSPTSRQSFKSNGAQYVGQLHVGNTRESNTNVMWRGLSTFDYNGLPSGKFIHTAQVGIGYVSGATTAQPGWVFSTDGACFACLGVPVTTYSLGTGWTDSTGWGVSQRIADGVRPLWYLSGNEEGSVYSHKRVESDFWVTYYDYALPSFGTNSPANAATGVTLTPLLTMTATNPTSGASVNPTYFFRVSTPGNEIVYESPESSSLQAEVPEGELKPNTTYIWRAYVRGAWDGHLGQSTLRSTGPRTFTTKAVAMPDVASGEPGNPVTELPPTVTTLTPKMKVDQVPGTAGVGLKYEFRVTSGADGKTGAVVTSGWESPAADGSVTWDVPPGSLQDGGLYTWTVNTKDAANEKNLFGWTKRFKVDLRLGEGGPSPTDDAGPVTVNLASGNATLSFASPTVATVGGPMGMSFTYNSQEVPHANRGLKGEYYLAPKKTDGTPATVPGDFTFVSDNLRLVRTDPSVRFAWRGESPADAIPADQFMARWTGFLTLPRELRESDNSAQSKPIKFGVRRDDGARLWIGDLATPLVNAWTTSTATITWSSPKKFDMKALGFKLDYFERSGHAISELWYQVEGGTEKQVPPDWFTKEVPILPAGWGTSTPIAGDATRWVSASTSESAVILKEQGGKSYTYTRKSAGGFTPPPGSFSVVSLDGDGRVVLTDEDGTVHQFSREGRIETSTAPGDIHKPAAPIMAWDSRGIVESLTDPAPGGRQVTFTYQNAALNACPTRSGDDFMPAPVDMLCVIAYPGGARTELFYNGDTHLAAIADPGGELTMFGYRKGGLLSHIRDSVANDVLPRTDALAESDVDAASTHIVYEDEPFEGRFRVKNVTLPAPDGLNAERTAREYAYEPGMTHVQIIGAPDHTSTAEYDAAWRQTAVISPETAAASPDLVTQSQTWQENKDLLLTAEDSAGRQVQRHYDTLDRPTDVYGPAPAACFDANRLPVTDPLTACSIVPAHTKSTYDGGYNGLRAVYYTDPAQARAIQLMGKPKKVAHGLAGTVAPGGLYADWGTGAGPEGMPIDNWSVRLTGYITFPAGTDYKFETTTDDGIRIWLNEKLVLDRWGDPLGTTGTGAAQSGTLNLDEGRIQRIRVEFYERAGAARLQVKWKKNGDSGFVPVPLTALTPDYGLVTQTVVDDSTTVTGATAPTLTTQSEYQHPWLGQATRSTVDPTGLALSTSLTFEQPGSSGWMRRLTRALPSAYAAPTTRATRSVYHDANVAAVDTGCGIPAGTSQYGLLRKITAADPQGATGITTEFVYDVMGRAVGARASGDSGWSCTTFDDRGLVDTQTIEGGSGTEARTISTLRGASQVAGERAYQVEVTETVAGQSTVVTTVTDLLGRVIRYTDASGTVTRTNYHTQTGRVSSVTTTPPVGGGVAVTGGFSYDLDGNVTEVRIDDTVYATVTYDQHRQVTGVSYVGGAAGALGEIDRDGAGRLTGQLWSVPGLGDLEEFVERSQSGRIVQHGLLTPAGPVPPPSTYSYDAAGRLVKADIPGHVLEYGFGAATACGSTPGSNPAAGKNGNRSVVVDSYTAPGQAMVQRTTSYCYDHADRLLSSTVSGAPT